VSLPTPLPSAGGGVASSLPLIQRLAEDKLISCLISEMVRDLVQVLMSFLMRRVMSLLMTLMTTL